MEMKLVNILKESLSSNFKNFDIDRETSEFILDWKQLEINGEIFNFIYPNLHNKNVFTIEKNGVGEIGNATLNTENLYLENIRIDPNYRRIGLATKLYQYIEGIIGKKLKPSPIKQSPDIKNFWSKRGF